MAPLPSWLALVAWPSLPDGRLPAARLDVGQSNVSLHAQTLPLIPRGEDLVGPVL